MARTLARTAARPAPLIGAGTRRKGTFWPYLLVAPALAGFACLLVYPLARSVVISFQHFRLGELIRGGAGFAGLANYAEALGGPEFWGSCGARSCGPPPTSCSSW